jgi:hypothetical protein
MVLLDFVRRWMLYLHFSQLLAGFRARHSRDRRLASCHYLSATDRAFRLHNPANVFMVQGDFKLRHYQTLQTLDR